MTLNSMSTENSGFDYNQVILLKYTFSVMKENHKDSTHRYKRKHDSLQIEYTVDLLRRKNKRKNSVYFQRYSYTISSLIKPHSASAIARTIDSTFGTQVKFNIIFQVVAIFFRQYLCVRSFDMTDKNSIFFKLFLPVRKMPKSWIMVI